MGFIGYIVRKCWPYALTFAVGGFLCSGVLSKTEPDYVHQKQMEVTDEKGKQYTIDLEKKVIIKETQEKRVELVDLLK